MSDEIKLVDESIQEVLDDLKTSIQALETSFNPDVKGENVLDMVESLVEVHQSIEFVLDSYQKLLFNNVNATSNAIESLKQTEEAIAFRISITK